ncbi:hypothetical protein J6590_005566 [Homalodisca vitripennis]|nr:hypothetical protein J6590_005566 [Homalodisca vitripennis]
MTPGSYLGDLAITRMLDGESAEASLGQQPVLPCGVGGDLSRQTYPTWFSAADLLGALVESSQRGTDLLGHVTACLALLRILSSRLKCTRQLAPCR